MNRRLPIPFPKPPRVRAPRKLKPATKDCARCENMLNRRLVVEHRDGGGLTYAPLPAIQCKHRGRPYRLNGLLTMTLCICCLRKIMKKNVVSARIVRPTHKAKADVHDSPHPKAAAVPRLPQTESGERS